MRYGEVIISTPRWLAVDRQIGRLSGGLGNPPGADCSLLIIAFEMGWCKWRFLVIGGNLGAAHGIDSDGEGEYNGQVVHQQ